MNRDLEHAGLAEARDRGVFAIGARWPARISIGIGTRETDDEALAKKAWPTKEELPAAIRARAERSELRLLVEPGATHGSAAWRGRCRGARVPVAADPLIWGSAPNFKALANGGKVMMPLTRQPPGVETGWSWIGFGLSGPSALQRRRKTENQSAAHSPRIGTDLRYR